MATTAVMKIMLIRFYDDAEKAEEDAADDDVLMYITHQPYILFSLCITYSYLLCPFSSCRMLQRNETVTDFLIDLHRRSS